MTAQLDPMEGWRAFGPNSLLWTRWWLENGGNLPASCHHVLAEKLAPWIAAVAAGGPGVREALLAVVPQIPMRAPEPPRTWIMPAIGKPYSGERDADGAAADTGANAHGEGPGGVTREPADVRQPPARVTAQDGVVALPRAAGSRGCASCGKAFKPYRPGAVFCSSACKQRAYRERKVLRQAA